VNIAHLLARAVSAHPHRPALIFSRPTRVITFRELDDRASRLAGGLHALGLHGGDRAIVLAPISPYLYAGLIALFRLGAAAVFLDPQAGRTQLDRAAALTDAKALIGSRRALWLRWLSPALRRIPVRLRAEGGGANTLSYLARVSQPRPQIVEVEPETPALITFTGGSTDSCGPRGVLRTHRLLNAQHAAIARALPVHPGDVDMPAFPIVTLHNLAAGITSVIPDFPFRRPEAVQPEWVLRQINPFGVTTASGSPAYWRPIAEHCLSRSLTLPLRRILTGGAPVAPALIERLSRIAPRAEILSVYGSTEAEPVALMPAHEILSETAALTANGTGIPLGHPVSEICVKVLNERGEEQPAGECGEIWVTGEHVARAYFANPQAEAANKRVGAEGRLWHRMGDMGYKDVRGRMWLSGRVNTVILRAGRAVYPVPVEAAIEPLPFVRRAALVGLPDAALGERAVLVIEFARRTPCPADWQARLRTICAEQGWPVDDVRAIPRLPVDARHNARIDYRKLKQWLGASHG
jgi:acyl-CoA synthetase (AMP-forming)/AMP-acid ligase II